MNLTFLFPLLGLVIGVYLSQETSLPFYWSIPFLGLSLGIWLTIHLLSKDPIKGYKLSKWHNLWISFLFIAIGLADGRLNASPQILNPGITGNTSEIYGTVNSIRSYSEGDQLILTVDSVKNNAAFYSSPGLKILVKSDGVSLSPGDKIKFTGILKKFSASSPKSMGYANYMRRQGILYYSTIRNSNFELTRHSSALTYRFADFKENCEILLEKSSLSGPTSGFLISIILGDKTFLSPSSKETISNAGLAHILALSGMHVAIVFSIVSFLFFPLSLGGWSKTRKVFALIFVWLYVTLTGFGPSTVRAAIMISLVVWAFMIERKNSPMNALLAAAFLIILIDPLTLWNIGFQLSFLCVATIILFVDKLNPVERHTKPTLYKVINLILISISVSFTTWILIMYYFQKVPLLFLLANILLVPLLPFFIGGGFLFLFLLLIGIDWTPLSFLLDKFYGFYLHSAAILSNEGDSVLSFPVDFLSVILWISAILLFAFTLYSKRRKPTLVILSGLMIVLSVINLILYQEPYDTRLVFHHSFTAINASYENEGQLNRLIFSRGSVSQADLGKILITAVDSPLKTEYLDTLIPTSDNRENYLIVGPKADFRQIAAVISKNNFSRVVLHSNIGRKQKGELLSYLEPSLHSLVHSLREEGSLEISL